MIRCYVVAVGRTSVEVRTDVYCADVLTTFAHTAMVNVNHSGRPMPVPGLVLDQDDPSAEARQRLAERLQGRRRTRRQVRAERQ